MDIAVIVMGAPYSSQSAYSAYQYTRAALESGKSIYRVFFYQDAVHTSTLINTTPQGEFDLYEAWQSLQEQYQIDCVTCIAAAARRGIINDAERARHNKSSSNHNESFALSGLGQFVEANARSDRVIVFGK